jgi:hypothetical protein
MGLEHGTTCGTSISIARQAVRCKFYARGNLSDQTHAFGSGHLTALLTNTANERMARIFEFENSSIRDQTVRASFRFIINKLSKGIFVF